MKISTKEFKSACRTILYAIDSKDKTLFATTLELKADGTKLHLNVTNRMYYVTVTFDLGYEEHFHATVNAQLFLNLIAKVTTDELDITCTDNYLHVSANGDYKLPMIYHTSAGSFMSGATLLELPTIEIGNPTNNFTINSDILTSIAIYNSKELLRGIAVKPVQKYYYMDQCGAITFTSGACVNNFTLESPLKVLLDDKVVRLFKLFKADEDVSVTIGQDLVADDLLQTKLKFETPIVTLTTILPDSNLISSVPVDAIRTMAAKNYDYSIVVEKETLLEALHRILLFNTSNTYGYFEFTNNQFTVYDYSKENSEVIPLVDDTSIDNYSLIVDLETFAVLLEGSEDAYVTINFGDHKAIVIRKNTITHILPEIKG